MTINERILALRRAAGLSQEALAEQVGVSRQAIGKWESGASLPGLDNLQELARALGVSCDELLTGKESGTENTAGQDGVALESVKALLDAQNAAQAHAAHRQRILLAGLAAALACVGAALVYLGVYYGGRMRELSSRVDDIGANVAGIEGSIDMRISSIQSSIEESLRQQASIVAGFDWDYGAPGTERRVPLTVTATPKNYRDGRCWRAMRFVRSWPFPWKWNTRTLRYPSASRWMGKPKRRSCSGNTILSRATRRRFR